MAEKGMSRRHIRKAVVRQMEKDFNIERFDYKKLVRHVKGKSRLYGIMTVIAIYSIGVGGAYFGWSRGLVPEDVMAKATFIAMVPSSVIGSVVWLIMDSRLEYPLRVELKLYIESIEGEKGLLWRYGPIAETLTIKKVDIPAVLALSKSGHAEEIDPQDYAEIVMNMYKEINSGEGLQLSGSDSKFLEEHLLNVKPAA